VPEITRTEPRSDGRSRGASVALRQSGRQLRARRRSEQRYVADAGAGRASSHVSGRAPAPARLRKVLRNGVFAVLPKPFDVGSPLADGAVRSRACANRSRRTSWRRWSRRREAGPTCG